MLYSLFIEDAGPQANRFEVRDRINEILHRPFDPEEAAEYDRILWAKKNVVVAREVSLDAYEAKPVTHPRPQRPQLPPATRGPHRVPVRI